MGRARRQGEFNPRILLLAPSSDSCGPIGKIASHLVSELQILNCTVLRLPWGNDEKGTSVLRRFQIRFSQLQRAAAEIRTGNFDVFIIKTARDWRTLARDMPMLLISRLFRTPAVVHLHGNQPENISTERSYEPFTVFSRLLARLACGLLVLSEEEMAFPPNSGHMFMLPESVEVLLPLDSVAAALIASLWRGPVDSPH